MARADSMGSCPANLLGAQDFMFQVNRGQISGQKSNFRSLSPFVSEHHEQWLNGVPFSDPVPAPEELPIMIAVGGGKGGVGKSIVSANISTILASQGFRVLVIDLDLGCSNLHTNFGVSMPKRSLSDFLLTDKVSFNEIILPAPTHGLAFIAGGRDEQLVDESVSQKDLTRKLWREVVEAKKKYRVDFVVFDLGAGTNRYTIDFFCASHLGIATVLPEPTSIENAYAFLKTVLLSHIESTGRVIDQVDVAKDVTAALNQMSGQSLRQGYAYTIRQLTKHEPLFFRTLVEMIKSRYVGLIVNQARDQGDMDIGQSMEHICQRYFGLEARYLSYLNYDEAVLKSIRNRRLLVSDFPHSLIVKRLVHAASQALQLLGISRRFPS
jgi:flagellar biosynthesis protein FlhG